MRFLLLITMISCSVKINQQERKCLDGVVYQCDKHGIFTMYYSMGIKQHCKKINSTGDSVDG